MSELLFRCPTPSDAVAISRLIEACESLDRNSTYAYLLLTQHFAGTCVVAFRGGEFVGFLSAYLPPGRRDALFVWQIAVAASARGQGLGLRLLDEVLDREACAAVRFVEATVSPSNHASNALLRSLARRRGAECMVSDLFPQSLFGDGNSHEAEDLYRIGPLGPARNDAPSCSQG